MSRPTTICLIGGAGFIGKALIEPLLASGRRIVCLDISKPAEPHPNVNYVLGDYGDKTFLKTSLQAIDEIVLLAYASVPKTSFENPLADLTSNLPPALTLFEVASQLPLRKMIILSSGGTVYGKTSELPIAESAPTNPISPYGITKLAIEKYAGMYHELHDLPVTILRPANAYGEGQRPFTGQGFIATAIASVLADKEIIIFGQAGSIRDYIHVNDIASAIVVALDKGEQGTCYNVGTGVGTTNQTVLLQINELARPLGKEARVRHEPSRRFDVPANILDATKLQTLGWQPTIHLSDGLKRAWDWYHEQA